MPRTELDWIGLDWTGLGMRGLLAGLLVMVVLVLVLVLVLLCLPLPMEWVLVGQSAVGPDDRPTSPGHP